MTQAVEVRGRLEGRVARLMAREPGRHDQSPTMQEATETLDASNSALSRPGKLNDHFTQLAQTGGKEVNAAILASSWNDRAKGMMREHAHTMIEHMQSFGKRGRSLTAADLVANSAADPPAPAA